MEHSIKQALLRGCSALDFPVGEAQQELLWQYLALLARWNSAYNLTAVRDGRQMVVRHLLDSLVVAPYLVQRCTLDVGTGAGLPGVPLAVQLPGQEFHLLDSNGKKARFLFQVKTVLGLHNIAVHQGRVESFNAERLYDAVISRAFSSLKDIVAASRHLLAPGGTIFAMKGNYPGQELAVVRDYCIVKDVHVLTVPELGEQRHLVEMALEPEPKG